MIILYCCCSTEMACTFLPQQNMWELSELDTFKLEKWTYLPNHWSRLRFQGYRCESGMPSLKISTTVPLKFKWFLTNIHGAGTTDSLPAGSPECQGRIHLILDLDQSIQHHGTTVVQIHLVFNHLRFISSSLRVPSRTQEG